MSKTIAVHVCDKSLYQGGERPGGETGSPLLVQCVMRRRTGTSAPSALPVQLGTFSIEGFVTCDQASLIFFVAAGRYA